LRQNHGTWKRKEDAPASGNSLDSHFEIDDVSVTPTDTQESITESEKVSPVSRPAPILRVDCSGQIMLPYGVNDNDVSKVALTPGEFAALFGKSQTWGYRQLYSGKVNALTGYGRTLIPVSEVKRVLSEAGRYMGAEAKVEKQATREKTPEKPKRKNPWRGAVENRRSIKGQKSKKRPGGQMTGLRNSAIRKLNRGGK